MGSSENSFSANLVDYTDLPIKLPSVGFDVRQVLFGKTIRNIGKYATKDNSVTSEFIASTQGASASDASDVLPKTFSKQQMLDRLKKLNQEIAINNQVLASARTVFPLTLFRDDVCVDRTKVTITKRYFFFMSEVMSIQIQDILNVKVSLGPFFGSITLTVRILNSEDHHTINYLWRKDAIHLKHIIQGYIIAHHHGIDLENLNPHDLTDTLDQLGHDSTL